MAIPTITNNSPTAGSFSWSAFGISFLNVNHGIAAGSSSKKFVWWRYGNGTPYLEQGDTLPNDLDDTNDVVLFLNKGGIAACVLNTQVMDGSLLVSGTVLADAIAANQIQTYHIKANAITADQLAANAVYATNIAAGAITADKLSVGTVSDNMVVNGSFEDALSGTLVGWEVNALSNGTIQPVTGQASSGAVSIQMAATATTANLRFRQLPAQYIPVSAASARKYYVSVRAGASVATTTGHYQRVNWYDANKVYISQSDIRSNGGLTTTFTLYEGQVTPPANARYMGMETIITNLNVATTVYIDEISAHEVTMSAQIGDGQITTAKMVANTINGDRIQAGTLGADKLLISDFTNYAQDGNFQDASKRSWTGSGTIITSTTEPNKLKVVTAASGNNDQSNVYSFNVTPGEQYYGEVWVYGEATNVGGGGPNLHLTVRTDAGTSTWPTFQSTTRASVQGAWTKLSGIVTIPAGARTAKVEPAVSFASDAVGNIYYFRQVQVRRMNAGEVIVDGAITTVKLDADAVTAEKIAANAITAREIGANVITAKHIGANVITAREIGANAIVAENIAANAIDGKTIRGVTVIGSEVKTSDVANTISARMGPTSVYGAGSSTMYPGIGFVKEGSVNQRTAGLYSVSGPDITLTQGGDLAYADNQAYVTLKDDSALIYARQSVDITGRNGMNVMSQVGPLVLSGNDVTITAANGTTITNDLTVNGTTHVKKLDNAAHWMVEFLNSTPVPSGALWGPGRPNPTAGTTDSTLISWPTNDTIEFRDAGIYALSAQIRMQTGVSNMSGSMSFVSFEYVATGSTPAYAKGLMGPGDNQTTASVANIKVAAGQQIKLYCALQTQGGGSVLLNWRINVTRIG